MPDGKSINKVDKWSEGIGGVGGGGSLSRSFRWDILRVYRDGIKGRHRSCVFYMSPVTSSSLLSCDASKNNSGMGSYSVAYLSSKKDNFYIEH